MKWVVKDAKFENILNQANSQAQANQLAEMRGKQLSTGNFVKKRWYHCWLKHSWSRWGEMKNLVVNGESLDTPVQTKTCLVCNRVELRVL